MVQVDGFWKLTDCPKIVTDGTRFPMEDSSFPRLPKTVHIVPCDCGGVTPAIQSLFAELEKY